MTLFALNRTLYTLNGSLTGNAIIVGVNHAANLYTLKSDYGNVFYMSREEIALQFKLGSINSNHKYAVQVPTLPAWKEIQEFFRDKLGMVALPTLAQIRLVTENAFNERPNAVTRRPFTDQAPKPIPMAFSRKSSPLPPRQSVWSQGEEVHPEKIHDNEDAADERDYLL